LVEQYAAVLASTGTERGLLGPREVPRLWDRHVLNSALLAPRLPHEATVADVGSGAGLPGIVLALARPDITVTLIESLLRRVTFLEEVVAELGLEQVEVVRSRAEEMPAERTFAVVTARAVAPLDRLARWCMPLVAPDGALVAMKGASAEDEASAARAALRDMGCAPPVVETVGHDLPGVEETHLVRVTWGDPSRVSLRSSGGGRRGRRRSQRRPRG
jgi:16S rRNA (guanine527-N7)-methyltransferase